MNFENRKNKPKLILHIGHSKTGTTSLQQLLSRLSTELLGHGYLYPTKRAVHNKHFNLPAGFVRKQGVTKYNNQNFKTYQEDFLRFWNQLGDDIESLSPHTVILSSEEMFRDFSEFSHISMAEFLGRYFSSVVVVAYIRSPARDYQSRVAQMIRSGHPLFPPAARRIRSVIEYYQGQFPCCVELHPFDRKQLLAGDILHDFISRYVPQALPSIEKFKVRQTNTSLPWPLLRGLQQIRQRAQPDAGAPSLSTRARIYAATKIYLGSHPDEQELDVRLLPEIEDFIRRSAVDHLWLKDQFGISFADLDYAQIKVLQSPFSGVVSLEQIVDLSKCPQDAFPVERYLGNGPVFWIGYLYFALHLKVNRIYRVFLRNSWLWRMKKAIFC